jgi:hypothetical protein
MKSPWQLGLLALAVVGVSTYDFLFFKNHRSQYQPSAQVSVERSLEEDAGPVLHSLSESAGSTNAAEFTGNDALPPISREKLNVLSQQAFVPVEFSETDSVWPSRDPFGEHKEPESMQPNVSTESSAVEVSHSKPLPEPQCVFSGTLIERENRLALVNGFPLSIGAQLGKWQLARIESDYIILKAGRETRRIELKEAESPAGRKEGSS